MSVVFSPSNMSVFMQCPRKFQGQSITKEIQWKPSKEKTRGTAVHKMFEDVFTHGWNYPELTVPDGMVMSFVTNQVADILEAQKAGVGVYPEHELAVTNKFKPCGWWDEDALYRCRADLVVMPTKTEPLRIVDFKTGKKYDTDHFQLRFCALLAHLIYKVPVVQYEYWYVDYADVDAGRLEGGTISGTITELTALTKQMRHSMRDNYFPSTPNRFCRWCDFYKTPACRA